MQCSHDPSALNMLLFHTPPAQILPGTVSVSPAAYIVGNHWLIADTVLPNTAKDLVALHSSAVAWCCLSCVVV